MEFSHWELRRTLDGAAADDSGQPPHARAFAAWIQRSGAMREPLGTLASDAAQRQGAMRQSVHAAVLGYAVDLDPKYAEAFRDHVDWLAQRQYFVVHRPPAFEVDGLALLGLAIGLSCGAGDENEQHRSWLILLLRRSLQTEHAPDWNRSLRAAALELLSGTQELVADDLRVALAARNRLADTQAARANAWSVMASLQGQADGMTRAAVQIAALTRMLREASTLHPTSTSVSDVAHLLLGVSRSMRRWSWDLKPRTKNSDTACWKIENEYHVQDLLWVVLAPVFPDLDDEEWLKSLGHHHPRADLAIPSLELIIEVKFMRKGGKSIFSEIIQEVAADASTYLQTGSGYASIIAFVWDDAARTDEHPELRQGLMRLRGVVDAIILSRPSKMDRDRAAAGEA